MIPAWHETDVIGKMAQAAASTLDYENYHWHSPKSIDAFHNAVWRLSNS